MLSAIAPSANSDLDAIRQLRGRYLGAILWQEVHSENYLGFSNVQSSLLTPENPWLIANS